MLAGRRSWVLIPLLALAVRTANLTARSVWVDEAFRISWAKGSETTPYFDVLPSAMGIRSPPQEFGRAVTLTANWYPPLYSAFYNPWLKLWGDSDASLRLLGVLFGLAAVGVVWLLTRSLFSQRAAGWAALLMALSPFQVEYSQEIGQYSLGVLLILSSMFFVVRYVRDARPLDGLAWSVTSLGAFYAHYSALLIVAGEVFGITLAWGREAWLARQGSPPPGLRSIATRGLRLAWPVGLVVLGIVPYLPTLLGSLGNWASKATSPPSFMRGLCTWWLGELAVSLPMEAIGLAFALTALLLVRGVFTSDRFSPTFLSGLFFSPLALLALAYLVTKNDQLLWPRYFVLFGSAFTVLAGATLARLAEAWRFGAAIVLLGGLIWGLDYFYRTPLRRPWREVAAEIDGMAQPDESVLVHQETLTLPLARYLKRDLRFFGIEGHTGIERQLATAIRGRTGVWLVLAWAERSAATPWLLRELGCRFESVEERHFWGVELRHYRGPRSRAACSSKVRLEAERGCAIEGDGPFSLRGQIAEALTPGQGLEVVASTGARAEAILDGGSFVAAMDLAGLQPGTWVDFTVLAGDSPVGGERCLVRGPRMAARSVDDTKVTSCFSEPVDRAELFPGDDLHVDGWAFAEGGIDRLELRVDGGLHFSSRQIGIDRGDVTSAYPRLRPEMTRYSGFSFDSPPLPPGEHRVEIVAVKTDGGGESIATRTIRVLAARPETPRSE